METPLVEQPAGEQQQDYCPRCGTAYEPLQEYCLWCGQRLPTNQGTIGVLAAAWQRRLPWYPGDWVWPTLAFLVLAILATIVAVLAAGGGHKAAAPLVATSTPVPLGPGAPRGTVTVGTTTLTAATPTIETGTLPTPPGSPTTSAPAATTPTPAGNPNALTTWPAGKSGYTVVLESVPSARGRAAADDRARKARQAGLAQAGVLDSSAFSSLHAGYYVVFSGVYASRSEANAGLASARAHGFPDAYPTQVTR